MKRALAVVVLMSVVGLVNAGVPERVVYQGRLSRSGAAVAESQQIKVTLIDPNGVEGPRIVFSGLVPLAATGEFSILLNMPANYDWERAAPELEIEVGGEVLSPREQINVSPYALLAKKVEAGAVGAAGLQNAAVTNEKVVAGVEAGKILISSAAGTTYLSDWRHPIYKNKINASFIEGTNPNAPMAHAGSHGPAGLDPLTNLAPGQIAGTAVVARSTFTQVMQPVNVSTAALAIKGAPGSGSKTLQIFDSGVLGNTSSVPQEQAYFDKDANLISNRSVNASALSVSGSLGIGTAAPTEKLEVSGGNLKVSGGIMANSISAATATIAGNINAASASFTGQSSVRVLPSAGVAVPNGNTVSVDFGIKTIDNQNEFNLATDRFVAKSAGQYLVTAQVNMGNCQPNAMYRVYIMKNELVWASRSLHSANGSDFTVSITDVIPLLPGDSIGIVFLNAGSAPVTYSSSHTFLAIHKVS